MIENARYNDGYYGTVSARHELRNMAGDLKLVLTTAWDNCAPSQGGQLRDVQYRIENLPELFMRGTFRLRTIVTMHNGVTRISPGEPLVSFR